MVKVSRFEGEQEWLNARRGKITGTRLKDIVVKRGTGKKIGFFELIAERLATVPDEENPMERGKRLEQEAMARFIKESSKEVDTSLVMWERDDDTSIAISPDGFIGNKEAVEVKCLSSARHIEAYLTNKVPDEYEFQVLQYFIVNDELETLHFCFYDPRMTVKDFFTIQITRGQVKEDVEQYLAYQRATLQEVNDIVNQLTF